MKTSRNFVALASTPHHEQQSSRTEIYTNELWWQVAVLNPTLHTTHEYSTLNSLLFSLLKCFWLSKCLVSRYLDCTWPECEHWAGCGLFAPRQHSPSHHQHAVIQTRDLQKNHYYSLQLSLTIFNKVKVKTVKSFYLRIAALYVQILLLVCWKPSWKIACYLLAIWLQIVC